MKKKDLIRLHLLSAVLVSVLIFSSCITDADPGARLAGLPDCSVEEIPALEGYERSFIIDIEQPLDHDRPSEQKFIQRVFLHHRSFEAPLVMHTSGYSVKPEKKDEVTDLIEGNLLYIPHRYYEYALPEGDDFTWLTIEQAAADHHRINKLFRKLYKGKFVSTGRSKGGMTAFFYKYFYPDDVDATVSIVAPIMYSENEPRLQAFFDDDPAKANQIMRIKKFQRSALQQREELAVLFEKKYAGSAYTFSTPFDEILEEAVLEIYFQFWQYGNGFNKQIPVESADADELFRFIEASYPLRLYADGHAAIDSPFYWQVYNEIGYYYFVTEHLEDLLQYKRADSLKDRYPGADVPPEPDAGKMRRIAEWLYAEGNDIIYIYGALDPFTTCAVEIGDQTNALKIVQAGKSHLFPLVALEDYFLLKDTLYGWLELEG